MQGSNLRNILRGWANGRIEATMMEHPVCHTHACQHLRGGGCGGDGPLCRRGGRRSGRRRGRGGGRGGGRGLGRGRGRGPVRGHGRDLGRGAGPGRGRGRGRHRNRGPGRGRGSGPGRVPGRGGGRGPRLWLWQPREINPDTNPTTLGVLQPICVATMTWVLGQGGPPGDQA